MDISFVLRKFRKSISGFTVLALLTSLVSFAGVAQAATFTDTDGHWGEAYIEALYTAGVVSGNPDGSFAPDNYLNRAELSKMLVLGYTEGLDSDAPAVYPDVAENDWYYEYANDAYQKGIMTGEGNGTFNGAAYVNRAVLMQAVYNAAGLTATGNELPFSDVMESDWFYDAVDAGYFWSIVDGKSSTSFDPAGMATRAEASKVIYNGWYPVERDVEDPTDPTDPTEPSSEGTLLMSVSSDTPEGSTIPAAATSVELVAYDLTAEDDDVVVESITANQFGISSMYSNHSVYAYAEIDGVNTRLTSGQTINSSTFDVKFNNLDLEVAEDETVRFSIRMDVGDSDGTSSTTGNSTKEVGIQIESADMVDVNGADVSGDFPLEGELFSIATDEAGIITIEKNGSVSNPQVGEDDVEIAKFKMTAATEAAELQELGLYISGSINTSDVEDFNLYVSGEDEPIATVDSVDSLDVVRFMIDDYSIAKGGTKSFIVTADFNTGRTSDTIKVYVDEDTDVLAIGDLYGFGMSITRTDYDGNVDACASASSADCSYASLEGGDLTISSNGPSASDIAINGNDVVLMNFDVTSVTDVTFKNFPVGLLVTDADAENDAGLLNGTTSNFTDIKIVDTETGDEIFSSVDSNVFTTALAGSTAITDAGTDEAQAYHLYTDDLTLSAGEELSLSLMVDVENNTDLDGETVVASLQLGSTYPELRDVNNKVLTNSSVLVPSSAITSKTHTVRSPSLTVSLASVPVAGSNTFVKGSEGVQFAGAVFACGDASDCRVTDLTLSGYLDDDADGSFETSSTSTVDGSDNSTILNAYVGSVWLEDVDGNTVSGPVSVNGTTFAASFTDIDWTLENGDTEILYVVGDISSDAFANSNAEAIAFGLTASTGLTVEDEDGNSFTASGTANTSQTTYVTTSEGGSLTIAVDSSKPNEDIVVAGTDDVEVAAFNFETTDEAFVVKKLSLNARQSGVASANLGDYDNNVSSITISYPNSDGGTSEATGSLTSGTANFTGLDFFIDEDDDETLTVYVDANTIDGGASATEFIELNLAFNNFEAIAQGSGETYTAAKLDQDTGASSDLDFGTLSWTDSGYDTNTVTAVSAAGASQTITIDTGTNVYPVGTLLFVDADANGVYDSSSESLFVVTTWSTTVPTVLVAGDDDASLADGLNVYAALPGTGYFTGTNQMHVQETKPTVALSSSSLSGGQTVSASARPLTIDVTADSAQDVVIRKAVYLDGETDLSVEFGGADGEAAVSSAQNLTNGGTNSIQITLNGTSDNDCWYLDTGYDLSQYARISGWYYVVDAGTGTTFTGSRYTLATDGNADATGNTEVALAASGNLTEAAWTFRDAAIAPTAGDQYLGVCLAGAGEGNDATDYLYIDEVKVYNEKVTLDIAGSLHASDGAQGLYVKMKNGSTIEAEGYIDQTSASAATVVIIPTIAQGDVEIANGDTETFAFETSTTTLVNVTSGDDNLTFSMDLGSASGGTVTAGDFWWYDDNETVKWLGDVSDTTINGSTLVY